MIKDAVRLLLKTTKYLIGILLLITVILVAIFIIAMLEYQGVGN